MLNTASGEIDLSKLFTDQPQEFLDLLASFNINIAELEAKFIEFTQTQSENALEFVSEYIVDSCSYAISYVISFLVILLVSSIALKILIWLCDLIFKLPILSTADTLLGVITGGALGLIFVYVFCMLSEYVMPYLVNIDNPFFKGVSADKTLIYKVFSQNNLLQNFVSALLK